MATREKAVVVHVCEGCGGDCDYPTKCLSCREAFCYDCRKTKGITYKHAVHCSGSDDGFYCTACDTALITRKGSKLHSAYRSIADLVAQYEAFYRDWEMRAKIHEAVIKDLMVGRT